MKILSMEFSPSSSQKPNKFALQPIKTCKTLEHFQLGQLHSISRYFGWQDEEKHWIGSNRADNIYKQGLPVSDKQLQC